MDIRANGEPGIHMARLLEIFTQFKPTVGFLIEQGDDFLDAF